jgi:hypothetical protein
MDDSQLADDENLYRICDDTSVRRPQTASNTPPSGDELLNTMTGLCQRRITRAEAQQEVKKLWLIRYDDDGEDEKLDEQMEEAAALESALEMSLHSDKNSDEAGSSRRSGPTVREREDDIAQDVRNSLPRIYHSGTPSFRISGGGASHSCAHCRKVPRIPKGAKKFKLVLSECSHFIALSYCWPKNSDGTPRITPRTYRYRRVVEGEEPVDHDGIPPDEAVDRAIEMAATMDIRQIWIDAACLSQDRTSRERRFGIQAIDLVYARCYAPVGLFETIFAEQRFMDACACVLYFDRYRRHFMQPKWVLDNFIDFLRLVGGDTYNRSAWCMQEVISSLGLIILSFRLGEGVRLPDWTPRHRLSLPQAVPRSFIMQAKMLRALMGAAFTMAFACGYDAMPALRKVLLKADDIYPKGAAESSPGVDTFEIRLSEHGSNAPSPCPRLNAADAVCCLNKKDIAFVEDRLVILANICDYEVRLDSNMVMECPSLAAAYMTLAVVNGDFSLTCPEQYTGGASKSRSGKLKLQPC